MKVIEVTHREGWDEYPDWVQLVFENGSWWGFDRTDDMATIADGLRSVLVEEG